MTIRRIIVAVAILFCASLFSIAQPNQEPVTANGSVFGAFREAYPDSTSPDAGCQLCHVNAGGGNPWNAYGWSIREQKQQNGLSYADAIAAVAALDADGNGVSNLAEINGGGMPGWTEGAVHTTYNKDGSTEANQSPPSLSVPLDADGGTGPITDPVTPTVSSPITNPIPAPITSSEGISVALRTVADGLISPLVGTATSAHPNYLFVVDQPGQVYQIDLATGAKSTFLDVSAQLVTLGAFGNFDERGLLGFAFHPDYATNGRVYTYQSEPVQGSPTTTTTLPPGNAPNHQSVVAEWTVANPADATSTVDAATKRVLLRIDQPQFNHNGGQLVFGPDGMLYIAVGDGGGADDADGQQFIDSPIIGHGPTGNGRDATNLLGTILRIDPLGDTGGNGTYGIPTDNPFVAADDERLDEIFAYGFRNVYRFSFDSQGGTLYAGDVGQNDIEEVDIVTSGGNYGWNYKEGSFIFDINGNDDGFVTADDPGDLPADLIDPIAEYDHDEGLSVIGGFIYRGSHYPALNGTYVFGDWSLDFSNPPGRLFHLDGDNAIHEFQLSNLPNLGMFLNGFGQDANGELYALGNTTGTPFPDENDNPTGVIMQIIAPLLHDEAVNGDLSDDQSAPTSFALGAGANRISATSVQGDREYYSITVPEGMMLESIILESYDSANQRSFIGIQSGASFTEPPTDTNQANLLGFVLFGSDPAGAGTDILDDMGTADGVIGFSGALPSGTYTIWSQETSTDAAAYSLNFVVTSAGGKTYLPVLVNAGSQ